MQYHYIYKTTLLCGSLAGKYYIGKRSTEAIPENCGYAGSGVVIRDYFKKYGKVKGETYNIEILELNTDKITNAIREVEWIGDKWNTDPMCINKKPGGDGGGTPGSQRSEETKKRISKSLKGNPKLSHKGENHPLYGKHYTLSEEARKKISETHKGLIRTEEHRKHLSEAMKGKRCPEETRKKISDTLKGNICWNKLTGAKSRFIKQCDENGKKIKIWDLEKECFDGFRLSHIKSCCNGERKIHKGFIWKWCIPVPFVG